MAVSDAPAAECHGRLKAYIILAGAVLIVSSAAIMIRYAQADGVPSISIAAWRLSLAALVLTPLVLATRRPALAALTAREWGFGLASGAFLAAHFAAWISSLAYTSVASSVALVATNPIWIALASWLILKERPSGLLALGIASAIGGSALIFLSDSRAGTSVGADPVLGNLLAVVGSLTVCGYLLIGRKLRARVALLPYIWLVYSASALCLMAIALASGQKLFGFSDFAWLMLAGLALGPQLLGHGAFNWALKHLSASFIAVATLGEPVGSAILAWLFLGEKFAVLQLCGFAALLVGIYLAAKAEEAKQP
ncbi:MAG: DMT family transporter [Betaproteobacteria bacterium]|nr:DMT family transporter [Betaproteobacteria bacterium]